jgi:TetR/AcrR family transcriptional regulator, transcriptional repressor for nem operon
MKVTREQAERNRERVLDVAGRLFRENGFDGIGVDGLMKGAGLTHGGFYANFKSKEELAAKSCERTLAKLVEDWNRVADEANGDPLKAIVAGYLAISHRDDPGNGCVLAALGADVARKGPAVRHAVTEGIRPFIELLTRSVPDVPGLRAAKKRWPYIYASLVGAMVLARAVDDPGLSKQILQTVAASV